MLIMNRRKSILRLLAIPVFTLILSGGIGGCSSREIAPALQEHEVEVIEQFTPGVVIGVEPDKFMVYSDRLIDGLENTGLFDEVAYLDSLTAKPDIVAKVKKPIHVDSTVPVMMLITLGIIPSVVEEDHGHIFTLQYTDSLSQRIDIDCVYSSKTYLGWVSGLLNLSENRIAGNPAKHSRYYSQLAYAIARSMKQ